MSDPHPEYKINQKKLQNLERLRKKKEAKISKNKQKKLGQIAARKKIKETRESLFEKLQEYQLDDECMRLLTSTSKQKTASATNYDKSADASHISKSSHFPKKLRCVSAEQLQSSSAIKRQQKNHIETDDSCSSMDENENIVENKKSQEEIQILDHQKESMTKQELRFEGSQDIHQKFKDEKLEEALKTREDKKKLRQAERNYYEILTKIKGDTKFVERDELIEQQRRKLPINAEEQPIIEAINENPVVIICGETGSGKTTQVPQFLYEAGYTSNGHLIGITEPRRIAAISMANRVGYEMAKPGLSSYQIRYEGNRTEQTKILFMTDGVLLKELQTDCTLSSYSVIIIDEAHERSIYSDVLIGLLSRICLARLKKQYPLKLVIMSATLRLNDFLQQRLFPNIRPKVLQVDSRQFPVSIYFERKTPENYMEAAFKKVCKIHEQYPSGGILVFLSGQNEVHQLIKLLECKYPQRNAGRRDKKPVRKRRIKSVSNEDDEIMDYDEFGIYDMDDQTDNRCIDDYSQTNQIPQEMGDFMPLHCLPLYSLLPGHLQKRVFLPPPEDGTRICVVSTNVAETSLTIPNIRYVIDAGKEKRRDYDPITGVSRFIVDWCSKASANQRSGRAGRVQSGYTFRLYSSAVYEDMPNFTNPEILNKPIEQLVLFLKSMGFAKLTNFPFPTPPKADQIKSAELRLQRLGALTTPKTKDIPSQITSLGCTLSQIPLAPAFAKILVCSFREGLLPYAVTLVSALSVREPLIPIAAIKAETVEKTKEKMAEMLKQRQIWCSVGEARLFGDLTVLLNVIGAADYENVKDTKALYALGLRPKAMDEINKLRGQLVTILNTSKALKEKLPVHFQMQPAGQGNLRSLRRIFIDCFAEKIAKKIEENDAPKGAYKTQLLEEYVFIDSSSMLYKEQPEYVLYQEIIQVAEKKVLQNVIVAEPEWIPDFINFDKNRM